MRSYRINTDRLVNQLIPHYLGGRKLILYLQSVLQPLKSLNESWRIVADERRIEAAMTSQVILLEHFLTRKFSKYFLDPSRRIVISDGQTNGVPLYLESVSKTLCDLPLYEEDETPVDGHTTPPLYWKDEKTATSDISFIVNCPAVNPQVISQDELTAMVSFYVNRYRIAGKKFIVKYI